MNLDHLPEVGATRLLWREQLRALRHSARGLFLRLTRREPRIYLVMENHVLARFATEADHQHFLAWIAQTHDQAFRYGFERGTIAPLDPTLGIDTAPDAGAAGPA